MYMYVYVCMYVCVCVRVMQEEVSYTVGFRLQVASKRALLRSLFFFSSFPFVLFSLGAKTQALPRMVACTYM